MTYYSKALERDLSEWEIRHIKYALSKYRGRAVALAHTLEFVLSDGRIPLNELKEIFPGMFSSLSRRLFGKSGV